MTPTTRFLLTVCTISPLTVAARHWVQGQAVETLGYIPGSALRGAVAGRLLRRGLGAADPVFRGLLDAPEVRFGNLYPLAGRGAARCLPLPATARSCKRAPGFLHGPGGGSGEGHGVLDLLVARVTGRDGQAPFEACRRGECEGDLDPLDGFYGEDEEGTCWPSQASTHLITRTALSHRREVADEGQLYALEALDEGQSFAGYVTVGQAMALDLEREMGRAEPLRIGAARSRGQGEVQVVSCLAAPGEHLDLPPLAERLARLEAAWAGAWPAGRFAFALTLAGEAIVVDDWLRCQATVTPGVLHHYSRFWSKTGESLWPAGLKLEHAVGGTRQVSGWNAAQRLPRWEELAVSRGSVVVLSVPAAERDNVTGLLARLEAEGLGERRREGFGVVVAAHPFHSRAWEGEEV